jgi:hypothetical protein
LTRVLADETSVNAIIRGLRARHVYLTQHPAYDIEFCLSRGSQQLAGDY